MALRPPPLRNPTAPPADQAAPEQAAPVIEQEDEQVTVAELLEEEESLPVAASTGRDLAPSAPAPMTVQGNFDDLDEDLGWRSFPVFKLQEGELKISGKENTKGFEFLEGVVLDQRKKFLFKARQRRNENDRTIPFAFSYDERMDTKGNFLEDIFADWQAAGDTDRGRNPVVTVYRELVFKILKTNRAESGLEGELVILNIPPASRERLAGYNKSLKEGRRLSLNQVVTRVFPGDQVKMQNGDVFRPWEFGLIARATPEMISGYDPSLVPTNEVE